jgi:hypothetical protein
VRVIKKKQALFGSLMILLLMLAACPVRHIIKASLGAAKTVHTLKTDMQSFAAGKASCTFEKEAAEKIIGSSNKSDQHNGITYLSAIYPANTSLYLLRKSQAIVSLTRDHALFYDPVPTFLRCRMLLI